MKEVIHETATIPIRALRGGPLTDFKVEERFSLAKHRETKRLKEEAYSLLGIFNAFMPLLYGEGRDNAFARLRKEFGKYTKRK